MGVRKMLSETLWKRQSCERVEEEALLIVKKGRNGHSAQNEKKEKHKITECKKPKL